MKVETHGVKLAILITGFDQKRETIHTVNMFRKWESTKDCAIAVVMSGDPDREVKFPEDKFTRVTTNDDIVGTKENFNKLVSTSIMKAISHGMLELRDLRRICGKPDILLHLHSDVMLVNEEGFWKTVLEFWSSNKQVAFDTVGSQRSDFIEFMGYELMPQIFMCKTNFLDATGFLHLSEIANTEEAKSTEKALLGNLHRRASFMIPGADKELYPYISTYNALVYEVIKWRSHQWGIHPNSYGGWCHYGNQLHFDKATRESNEKQFLATHNTKLE